MPAAHIPLPVPSDPAGWGSPNAFNIPTEASISRITPYRIYIGNRVAASDLQLLQHLRVTHILNAATECDNYFPKSFVYKRIQLNDEEDDDVAKHLSDCARFIDNALQAGGTVLVHCNMGVSRSSTLVLYWLVIKNNWSLEQGFRFIQKSRTQMRPNQGFLRSIIQYRYSSAANNGKRVPAATQEKILKDLVFAANVYSPRQFTANEVAATYAENDYNIGITLNVLRARAL